MHEYSLAQAMMERVEREALAHRAVAVHSVRVRIGRLSGVEPGLFATAFDVLRPGTLCDKADLELVAEEGQWLCVACGHALPPEGALTCPKCDWPARLERGGDLVLERIEMEVPNV